MKIRKPSKEKKAFNSVVIAKLLHVLSVDYYFAESASLNVIFLGLQFFKFILWIFN